MSPSYQTVPPANAPKEEPSSTPVPMMKKVAVVAMVGTALVVGYSYGASTNPARIDIATTTMTTTATAANLVRGGVRNGDNSFAEMEKEDCITGPCNKNRNEKACLSGTFTKGCNWYPQWGAGGCSSCSGVGCGSHRAVSCRACSYYDGINKGKNYCNGECIWDSRFNWRYPPSIWPQCYPK